tara:strand:- start:311 stop:535 length:225 start_codon:yes stop_codon:yes gene_type:complete
MDTRSGALGDRGDLIIVRRHPHLRKHAARERRLDDPVNEWPTGKEFDILPGDGYGATARGDDGNDARRRSRAYR